MGDNTVVVIGAGPAGITAAHELVKNSIDTIVLEKDDKVGGISRTEYYKGYRIDIGGHRFYTKIEEAAQLWSSMLNGEFLDVDRLSHIYFKNKFIEYPLNFRDVLNKMGVTESILMALSYLKMQIIPNGEEKTFEQYVTKRFGRRLYNNFFKTYTEKVWGMRCDELGADWAAQRINGMNMKSIVKNALFGGSQEKSLITQFQYPSHGPGMMWSKVRDVVEEKGGEVLFDTEVVKIKREGNEVKSIIATCGSKQSEFPGKNFLSSMPLSELIFKLDPPPPDHVLEAARKLRYRAFIITTLIINKAQLFDANWVYVHCPNVKVGRMQNFKNWSRAMTPDQSKTSLGMEYFCEEGDELWKMPDDEILKLATSEMAELGLGSEDDVEDGVVYREPKAYPVYDLNYGEHLQILREYIDTFSNLQTIGRNGLHRYNNQDHSMLTGINAVKNILGGDHDLWGINTEKSHHEKVSFDH